MKMNPVVHFEMPAEDSKRMADFYEKTFGWKTNMMGPDMGNYVVVATTETGANGMATTPGAINGGFYQRTEDPKSHAPSVVIAVDDIKEAMKKVETGGGKLLGGMAGPNEPDNIPGVGLYMSLIHI